MFSEDWKYFQIFSKSNIENIQYDYLKSLEFTLEISVKDKIIIGGSFLDKIGKYGTFVAIVDIYQTKVYSVRKVYDTIKLIFFVISKKFALLEICLKVNSVIK